MQKKGNLNGKLSPETPNLTERLQVVGNHVIWFMALPKYSFF